MFFQQSELEFDVLFHLEIHFKVLQILKKYNSYWVRSHLGEQSFL